MKENFKRVSLIGRHLTSAHPTEQKSEHSPNTSRKGNALPFDPQAVLKKYESERDIRIRRRPEGNQQYKPLYKLAEQDSRFAAMLKDPWSNPETRDPKHDQVEVTIVGAGYGGLGAGAQLVMNGIDPQNIRIVDSAGDVGGTWYWNRYPGAACDVESYTYMPFLEEIGYIPSEKYAKQPELIHHSKLIAETYGLYQNALFNTKCTELKWEDDLGMWMVSTDKGDRFMSKFVFMNFGTLPNPKLPGCSGIESFKGHMMHTARWDYSYTGGDSSGGMTNLRNKRVAIIGTGATAVQVIPHLGEFAKELYVFQRTPSSVDERGNKATTEEFVANALSKPGWQKERMNNFTIMTQTNIPGTKDLIEDGWTKIFRNLQTEFIERKKELIAAKAGKEQMDLLKEMMMLADMKQMHSVRERAEETVNNKQTAEALKPWYQQFCKRPCFHDEYLTTFNRPNVNLIHDPLGVEKITEKGVVSNGSEYSVDLIIFATGFETGAAIMDCGYPIYGVGGLELKEKWKDGPRTLRSMNTSGFPNLFLQNSPQGTFTVNFVQKLVEESKHAAFMISEMNRKGLARFDVTAEAEDEHCEKVFQKSGRGARFLKKCTPGYYNREGQLSTEKTLSAVYMAPLQFFSLLEQIREDGTCFEGFVVQ